MSSILSGNELTYLFALLLVMLECAAELSGVGQISRTCKTQRRCLKKTRRKFVRRAPNRERQVRWTVISLLLVTSYITVPAFTYNLFPRHM